MVRVLGDVSGLANSFKTAGEHAAGAAGKAKSAFSGLLGTLNQTGILGPFGESLSSVNEALDQVQEHHRQLGAMFMGVGSAAVGAGLALSTLGSHEKASHAQLQAAVEATGHSYDDYGKSIDKAIKHEEHFGDTSEQTQDALRILTQATGDPTKALNLLGEATDLAAAKHEDLSSAATALGKVWNGNTKLLKEFGIQATSTATLTKQAASASRQAQAADANLARTKRSLADIELIDGSRKKLTIGQTIQLRNAEEAVATAAQKDKEAHTKLTAAQEAVRRATSGHGTAVDQLGQKLKGQAAAAADTFTGHLKAIKAEVEDQAAKFGQKYGPAITAAGTALTGLGAIMQTTKSIQEGFSAVQKTATATTEAMSAAEDAAAVSEGAALWPILLIVAAIALLIAAAYLIYKNWQTIWGGIKAIIEDVWLWIQKNWPLLLGILLGPIALAAALIWKYWGTIKKDAQAVVDWIVGLWNGLVAFFSGIPGRLVAVASGLWHFIYNEANAVLGWVEGVWNAMIGWLAGLPGRIYGIAAGMWNSIYGFANVIYGDVVGVWNAMIGWLAGLPGRIAWVGGQMWNGFLNGFKAVLNGIIDLWNRLHFTIGGWKLPFGIKVPTVTVGMPTIPHLAQGGLITREGLIYAHAGEAVTPAKDVGRMAPAVHIEHAHFAETLDVDAFLGRVAWAARTRAV
jgi:hypothetical protein